MGDLLGIRIIQKRWEIPNGLLFKALVWGSLGMVITLMFTVFIGGTEFAQSSGLLPFEGSLVFRAIFASIIMNATFGPMLYVYHKFGDLLVDSRYENENFISVKGLVNQVDWYSMVHFSWLKTCIFVWMPCHGLVLMLPAEYRVVTSAFLSILLGILVSLTKSRPAVK